MATPTHLDSESLLQSLFQTSVPWPSWRLRMYSEQSLIPLRIKELSFSKQEEKSNLLIQRHIATNPKGEELG